MLHLGSCKLEVPFFQASLSGYSDMPMRVLAREFGAPLTFSGVLLDKIALHPRAIRKLLFQTDDDIHPVGAQILGSNPETMAAAARSFLSVGYDLMDLNFACPAPKVLRRQRGGFLLKRPSRALEILRTVRRSVQCPLLVKLRIGYDSSNESSDHFWQLCEGAIAAGADALVIHGRTVTQKYSGKADWQMIAEVKQRFSHATILGSGDIYDGLEAKQRVAQYGLDGVILARGAIGNPWIFREARAAFENIPQPDPPSLQEQGETMIRHIEMICRIKPERKAIPYFRKFLAGYCKRHPERKKTLMRLMVTKSKDALIAEIQDCYGLI